MLYCEYVQHVYTCVESTGDTTVPLSLPPPDTHSSSVGIVSMYLSTFTSAIAT